MSAFVKPELLDGNNQYSCEKCKSKQNAEKGLRITQFSYLLTIQLKRFDFDYQTLHRIKLNERVTFPDVLDLNGFLHHESGREHSSPRSPTGSLKQQGVKSYASVASSSRSLSKETIEEEDEETSDNEQRRSPDKERREKSPEESKKYLTALVYPLPYT